MIRLLSLVLFWTLAPVLAIAQSLGTFRWQLEPYCNIVTLAVTQSGAVYEVEGTDDQCGAATAASASGTAFLNPDGSIGFGLNIVTSPSATPVHVEASIGLATLSGTWHDSAGGTGAFRFTPNGGTGGAPRPAAGLIGAASVNPSQVQLRVKESCPNGMFMQEIDSDGSVSCESDPGDISSVVPEGGLTGGGLSGSVSLRLATTLNGAFLFNNYHGFAAVGTFGSGGLALAGPGTRAMWSPGRAAFRAGEVRGTQWDLAAVGDHSVAFGLNTTASGAKAFAMGDTTVASGGNSTAFGAFAAATAFESVAMGLRVAAGGNGSVVLGSNALTSAAAPGTFIFADRSTGDTLYGVAPNEFLVRASGGVAFYTNAAGSSGAVLDSGASAWSAISDANMKENFRDLDDDEVLAKIARMPIREWNYKAQDAAIRHVGPTAQDFHAAFGLGEDSLRISTIDADGIALAAVRALEARSREMRDRYSTLSRENEALNAEIAELRRSLEDAKKALAALIAVSR
jgi:trimeric autotransporter adhesin